MCLGIAIGLSVLFTVVVHFLPRQIIWVTVIGSLVVLLGLAVMLYAYKTTNNTKIIISVLLALLWVVIAVSIWMYRKQITLSGIFLDEGTKFTANKPASAFYILLFLALSLGFFFMLIYEYSGLVSMGTPSFSQDALYYEVNKRGLWATWIVLGVQLIWGIFFLKEACKHHPIQSISASPLTQCSTTSRREEASAPSPMSYLCLSSNTSAQSSLQAS
jgi:uncharacterized membrane protein